MPNFNKDFTKNYSRGNYIGYILKIMSKMLNDCTNYTMIHHFYLKERELQNVRGLWAIFIMKKICFTRKNFEVLSH